MRKALALALFVVACGARSELAALSTQSDGAGGAGPTTSSTSSSASASSSSSSASSSSGVGGGPVTPPACTFDACAHAQCPPVALAGSTHPIWVDSDGVHVYWATDNPPEWVGENGVYRVDKSGANIVPLHPGYYVNGVPTRSKDAIYLGMGNTMQTQLLRVPVDGGATAVLGTWTPPVGARSVHVDGATAYLVLEDVSKQEDEIARIGIDGTMQAPLVSGLGVDVGTMTALLGDAAALYTILSDPMGETSLVRIAKADGALSTLAVTNYDGAIAQDEAYVYLGDFNPGPVLQRVPKAGGPVEILASGIGVGAIAVGEGFVYFSDQDTGVVNRVPVQGGAVEALVSGMPYTSALALVDHTLYFGTDSELCRLDL
jgi:hypothetical protein